MGPGRQEPLRRARWAWALPPVPLVILLHTSARPWETGRLEGRGSLVV